MKNNLEKVIITGGAGFIGSNLANHLFKNGTKEILIIDDLVDTFRFSFGFEPTGEIDSVNFPKKISAIFFAVISINLEPT